MSELFSAPDPSAAPEEGSEPAYRPEVNNLAGDKELCDQYWQQASKLFADYDNRDARKKFMETGGTADVADRMIRASLNRKTTDQQYQPTYSDVTSTEVFKAVRSVTANEVNIFLGDQELPAMYLPNPETDEYRPEEGVQIAECQNAIAEVTFDEDKRRHKIQDILWWKNTYGQVIVSDEWDYRVSKRRERVPTQWEEIEDPSPDGTTMPSRKAIAFDFKDVERVDANNPTLILHDLKDCWFDSEIGDSDNWEHFIKRNRSTWTYLSTLQNAGEIMNMDKLTDAHLYSGDKGVSSNDVLENRKENAEEGTGEYKTGAYLVWHVWQTVPIREKETKGKKNGKGQFNAKKAKPDLYWGMFAGKMGSKDAVCLKLVKNPYPVPGLPYKMCHAMRDNKGAYRTSPTQMVESLYWQAVTTINQAIDNSNEINKAPWILDGPLLGASDMTFHPSKAFFIHPGTTVNKWEVPNNTGMTLEIHAEFKNDIRETFGVNDAVQGIPFGARATSSEVTQALEQAILPLDEGAGYFGDQFFGWLFERDAAYWRYFADPARTIAILRGNHILESKPAELWGPLKTKVTAVTRFKNRLTQRVEMDRFMQTEYSAMADTISPEGKRILFAQLMQLRKLDRIPEILGQPSDQDAIDNAKAENHLMFVVGAPATVTPQQNQPVHIRVHKEAVDAYKNLPREEIDNDRIGMVLSHIAEHEQMHAGNAQQVATATGPVEQPQGMPPELPQMSGEVRKAELGAIGGIQ